MTDQWKELTALETKVRDAIHSAIESDLYMPELNLAAHRATQTVIEQLPKAERAVERALGQLDQTTGGSPKLEDMAAIATEAMAGALISKEPQS